MEYLLMGVCLILVAMLYKSYKENVRLTQHLETMSKKFGEKWDQWFILQSESRKKEGLKMKSLFLTLMLVPIVSFAWNSEDHKDFPGAVTGGHEHGHQRPAQSVTNNYTTVAPSQNVTTASSAASINEGSAPVAGRGIARRRHVQRKLYLRWG